MLEFFAYLWVFLGFITWIRFPNNDFSMGDFVIGLPMCIIFWPKAIFKGY